LRGLFQELHEVEQHQRSDHRHDDRSDQPERHDADQPEDHPAEYRADDADDQVADQSEAAPFPQFAGNPAGQHANNQKPENIHGLVWYRLVEQMAWLAGSDADRFRCFAQPTGEASHRFEPTLQLFANVPGFGVVDFRTQFADRLANELAQDLGFIRG